MPDLKVIEGGGGGGKDTYAAHRARVFFQDLVIELLRDLAREAPESWRVSKLIFEFWKAAAESQVPVFELIEPVLRDSRDELFQADYSSPKQQEREEIIRHAFRVAAESLASDGAARGRASQRESRLRTAIEDFITSHETRAREHGWSYLDHLTRGMDPVRREPAPAARTRSSRKSVKAEAPARSSKATEPVSVSQPVKPKRPDPKEPPSYQGLKRYPATKDELAPLGFSTLDDFVAKANELLLAAGRWPLSQGDFPGNRAQFRKIARIIEDLKEGSA
jgi:hypothetical protein